jgi:hypothetical protein
MEKDRQIPWPRILAESVAIVVSILLAFWIQAWWDNRQEREDERAILTTLLAELSQRKAALDGGNVYHRAIRESARQLLDAAAGPNNRLNDQDLDHLLSDLTWYTSPPTVTELNSLVSSGNISLVSNRELRRRLGVVHASLDRFGKFAQMHNDFYLRQLMPFMQRNTYLPQISNALDSQPGSPKTQYPIARIELKTTVSHREILNNREFQNLLLREIWLMTGVIEWRSTTEGVSIEENLVEIISLIEQELTK